MKIIDTKIKDIERYLNSEIFRLCNKKGTSKELKSSIINVAYSIFDAFAQAYRSFDFENDETCKERITVLGYRGINTKFSIEIQIKNKNISGSKYLKFDISSSDVLIKNTKEKQGKSYIYEITNNTFDFSKLYLKCSQHTMTIHHDNIHFKWDMEKTIRENFELF